MVYLLTLTICVDEIRSRRASLEKANAKIAELQSNLDGSNKKRLAAIKEVDSWKRLAQEEVLNHRSENIRRMSETATRAVETHEELELARKKADLVKQLELATVATPSVEIPRSLTQEEKLAAYESSGIDGVPYDVSRKIITTAKSENRGAFSAVYEIEQEAAGYKDVTNFQRTWSTIPASIRKAILEASMRKQPDDWSRQAESIKENTSAWNTLKDWKMNKVPGFNKKQSDSIIAEISAKYPNDFPMIIYCIGNYSK